MNVLDYNIPENQTTQLRNWQIRFSQIGYEIGRPEWDDQQEILRYLHHSKRVTFFTCDLGFFNPKFCHANYCVVVAAGQFEETASLIRRFLRCPEFKTYATRAGKAIKLTTIKIYWWERGLNHQQNMTW